MASCVRRPGFCFGAANAGTARCSEPPVDAIIGYNFFRDRVVMIDCKKDETAIMERR